jgi:hypothetical protein
MLSIKARFRPTRSAINPNATPPIPEASNVRLFNRPAVPLLIPRSRMTCARTRAYSMASKASSIQPRAAATRVLRCAEVMRENAADVLVAMRTDCQVSIEDWQLKMSARQAASTNFSVPYFFRERDRCLIRHHVFTQFLLLDAQYSDNLSPN